jgi:murein DD-endopeptidase MepM/ murein hydrolase activator NlpD
MSEFDELTAAMKRIESYAKSTEEHWRNIASSMTKAAKSGGGVGGTGGQRGHGKSRAVMDGSQAAVSDAESDFRKAKRMMEFGKPILHTKMNEHPEALSPKILARAAGTRKDAEGNTYAGKFDAFGRPIGGVAGAFNSAYGLLPKMADKLGERALRDKVLTQDTFMGRVAGRAETGLRSMDAFAKSGGTFGAMSFNSLPPESQARISSSMYGISDTVSLLRGVSNATNSFLPGVGDVMNRATGYYNATLYGGNQRSRADTRDMTYGTMAALQGITSPGSDAQVAQFLASRGMSASKNTNSTYQQTLRTVANAGRYMNISNQDAVASVEGLTSARGSAEMLRNFGIYTADLNTGKEKTQSQIFEELAQRLTAGRGQATVEQTQSSIRRGALGVTIDSFFKGDQQGAQMFKQYMIERAGGKKMDLSQNSMVAQPEGNRNPLNAQYELTQKETGAMNGAETPYISGINMATKALGLLTDVSGGLVKALGSASAMIQTLFGNKRVQGLTEGLTTVVDFASKGVSGIGDAIAGMDMSMPPYSTMPALLEAGMIAGSMGASLGSAAAIGGAVMGISNMGGGGPEGSMAISSGKKVMGGRKSSGQSFTAGGGMGMSTTRLSSKAGSGGPNGFSDARDLSGMGSTNSAGPQPMFNFDWLSGVNITTQYGVVDGDHSNPHGGTDFGLSGGTPIKSVGNGKVVFAGPNGGYGNMVAVAHYGSNGRVITSIYAHMLDDSIQVGVGQQVAKGDVLGLVGSTGHSTGNHLHLEFREGEGLSGATMSMSDAGRMLTNGTNSDGSSWGNSGSSVQGASSYNISAASAAIEEAKGYQKTPAAATGAMKILQGLYSGNQSSVTSAMKQIAANMGVSGADWNKYMNGNTGALPSSPTAPPGGFRPPNPAGGTPINNNVSITVQVPDVTSADAIKFGQLVKQYLDSNTLTSNTGSM